MNCKRAEPKTLTENEDIIDARVVPDKQVETDEAGEDDRHCEDAVNEEEAIPGRYRRPRLWLETCTTFVRLHAVITCGRRTSV